MKFFFPEKKEIQNFTSTKNIFKVFFFKKTHGTSSFYCVTTTKKNK